MLEEFRKQAIEQEVRKHEIVIVSAGYNGDQVTKVIIAMVEAVAVVIEIIEELAEKVSEWFKESNFLLKEMEINREMYKLNLSRPIIRDQVMDRKPKRLIKKIIH